MPPGCNVDNFEMPGWKLIARKGAVPARPQWANPLWEDAPSAADLVARTKEKRPSNDLTRRKDIADTDNIAKQLPGQVRSGILVVNIFGADGLDPSMFSDVNSEFKHSPYALLEFDKSQIIVLSSRGSTREAPLWSGHSSPYMFDVSRVAELRIWLYLEDPKAPGRCHDIYLGASHIMPCFEEGRPLLEWLDLRDGSGRIQVKVEYTESTTSKMEPFNCSKSERHDFGGVMSRISMRDSLRVYAYKTFRDSRADLSSTISAISRAMVMDVGPFITPLKFAFQFDECLHLFSPGITGGHLLYYLRQERVFDIARCTLYAAELVCAIEHIHASGLLCRGMKPWNILLDAQGHITICDFTLFFPHQKDETLEYPSPELLTDSDHSISTDWWTLGVFLYEMLVGIPPFYAETTQVVHRKILTEQPPFPLSLPVVAKQILSKLLDRSEKQRLGANGVSEIKDDAFFQHIDWKRLVNRGYKPAFRPESMTVNFMHHQRASGYEDAQLRFAEMARMFGSYHPPPNKSSEQPGERTTAKPNESQNHEVFPTRPISSNWEKVENDAWSLVWDTENEAFHFYNTITHTTKPLGVQFPRGGRPRKAAQVAVTTKPLVVAGSELCCDTEVPAVQLPDMNQKKDALERILKLGYFYLVPQLLQYGVDLNSTYIHPLTALNWATQQARVDLVKLLLEWGADANSGSEARQSALELAVERGSHELVQILLPRTNRVACVKALGIAVDRKHTSIVRLLLTNGVPTDFEDADRPPPLDDIHRLDVAPHMTPFIGGTDCCWPDIHNPQVYIPPLVRAVNVGDLETFRLLLKSGADPNAGYHELARPSGYTGPLEVGMCCGRVVQLAMELGHTKMVHELLDAGADVELPQPIWLHWCELVPRAIYLRVTSGLRAIVAEKNELRKAIA